MWSGERGTDRSAAGCSTTENVCVYIYDQLLSQLPDPLLLHSVRVHETDKNVFTYYGQAQ